MAHELRVVSSDAAARPREDGYAFGPVRVDVARHVVTRHGRPIPLAPKTFELLLLLVRSDGRVLTRQELVAGLWPDTFVEEANLSFQIATLRKAIGDSPAAGDSEAEGTGHWIATVPRVGYRFTPEVRRGEPTPPVLTAVSSHPETTSAHRGHRQVTDGRGAAEPPAHAQPMAAAPLPPSAASRTSRTSTAPLTRIAAVVGLVLAAVSVAWYVRTRTTEPIDVRTPSVRSIAVLPFEDLSAGQGDLRYADGLTEALIAELSTLDGLNKVIGRQSVARFRAAPMPLRDAARALDVDGIVTASVLRSAGRLRVTARLVDGATERHLWAGTFERSDGEVLVIQREIAQAIARAVHLALSPGAAERMPSVRAVRVEAFDAYIAGRQAVDAGPANSIRAVGHFEKAVALEPDFAPAHAALAYALWHASMSGLPPHEALRRGKAAAARAIALDANLGEAHAASGLLALHGDWDWATADAALRRAVSLHPNSAMVRLSRVHHLVLAGRYDEAPDDARRSIELEPSSHFANGNLAWAAFNARRYDESVRRWRDADRLGQDPVGKGIAVLALALAGRSSEVLTRCPAVVAVPPDWRCAEAHALLGSPEQARLVLARIPDRALLPRAELHAAMGDAPGTVRVLERAYDEHATAVLFMNAPIFDRVRHDPSFRDLQRRVNYPAMVEGDGSTSRE